MYKNPHGQIITFNLSFEQWRKYFWIEFNDCKGEGPTDDTNPAIAAELHDAYDKSVSPDNEDVMEAVFGLQLDQVDQEVTEC